MKIRRAQNSKLLGKYGRKKWKDLAELMRPTATNSDWDLLESYCMNWQMSNSAAEEITTIGTTVLNGAGTRVQNPANAMFNAAQKQLIILSKELNLTELSQHRNQMESNEDDGFDI
ncbi:P27 family phage terminase small subunit [Pseudoalteromonas sp. KJ10-2]|uniref:P27 family phage terminase small subunit n=1 Tax=Psychromonas sp. KJ10-2 TaxID=3391822 RepID=UPI0039B39DDB